MASVLQIPICTDAQRLTITPAVGEIIYITDTKKFYGGDGSTSGGILLAGLTLSDTSYGDVTVSSSGSVITINPNTVTFAKIQEITTGRILGRDTSGTGDIEQLTPAAVRGILNVENGADVTDSVNVDSAGAVMNTDTSTASMAFVVDEDNMSSDSSTKIPTQQSVKAYVDSQSGGASQLSDLSDVNTSTATNRNVLVADGTDFESRALTKADVSDHSDADYATAAQGTLADSATQPADNISTLTNDSGFITSYTVTEGDVTAHQGAIDHDALTNFVANEHIDWTQTGAGTIDASNYTNTTYSVGDGGLTEINFTSADNTKLDGIEPLADVTDVTNVVSALDGAVLTDVGTPASDDKILVQDASDSDNIKVVQASTLGGGGGGSVTSVAVSGSDGIQVDSGSPVTGSGTIALGVDAGSLRTHLNVENGATASVFGFHKRSSTSTATYGTGTLIPWQTAVEDTTGGDITWSSSNNTRFTINTDGQYCVGGFIATLSTDQRQQSILQIYVNGVNESGSHRASGYVRNSGNAWDYWVYELSSTPMSLSANDYVEIRVAEVSGSTYATSNNGAPTLVGNESQAWVMRMA